MGNARTLYFCLEFVCKFDVSHILKNSRDVQQMMNGKAMRKIEQNYGASVLTWQETVERTSTCFLLIFLK